MKSARSAPPLNHRLGIAAPSPNRLLRAPAKFTSDGSKCLLRPDFLSRTFSSQPALAPLTSVKDQHNPANSPDQTASNQAKGRI